MPRVKIDYVVSVTSEDPDHPASNLLANEVSKRRWLCSAGAGEGAVLLQLKRAVNICGVHIGAHQAAFVEVLVGSADRPVDQYEVLVPRCVFASPAECRRAGGGGAGGDRVRSFSADQLAEGARGRRWDRVRLLCSQPYNKHCQFGLSFIHIYEPEAVTTESSAAEVPAPISASVPTTASAPAPAPSPAPAPRDTLLSLGNYSSDEEEFQPGALFAKHQQSLKKNDDSARFAQIRKASAQALKDIPDANTRLKKTPIESSGKRARHRPGGSGQGGSGQGVSDQGGSGQGGSGQGGSGQGGSGQGVSDQGGSGQGGNGKGASAVLRGVVFAMSGFVNPERAKLRAAGLALGARYRPDWTSDCTHLICAFPNTPKLKKVVASSPHAHVVSGDWLRACQRTARRQPEAPHSLRPHRPQHQSQTPPPPPPPPRRRSPRGDDTDDTDDEIEKVRANNKRPRLAPASPSAPPTSSSDNDVSFVCDERFKGSVTLSDDSSTEEEPAGESAGDGEGSPRRPLPPFLEGLTFTVTGAGSVGDAGSAGCDTRLLARYVRAYGGLLLQDSELEQGAAVDYVVCAGGAVGAAGARGLRVRADWVWRCHELRALAPTLPYELPS
ncbi:DNA repair protein XRCC1 [Papilio xuthus]|uniref:DNA repair protein XRCC1 n=1 Tax=Papilio xuthus TaxID=66420 RepID=A0A194PIV8_PAPXU|nr:DNA repair protein XRCC1 [Papilio xuthus]